MHDNNDDKVFQLSLKNWVVPFARLLSHPDPSSKCRLSTSPESMLVLTSSDCQIPPSSPIKASLGLSLFGDKKVKVSISSPLGVNNILQACCGCFLSPGQRECFKWRLSVLSHGAKKRSVSLPRPSGERSAEDSRLQRRANGNLL